MKQYLKYWVLLFFITVGAFKISAQTCTLVNNDTIICEGTNIAFSVNISSGTPLSYDWNFGNGFTANTASPAHTFTFSGNFTPTVLVTFAGGATCLATGSLIKVRANPKADFTVTTADEMCFKGNELCIVDQSKPGISLAPIKQRAFQLSNGYLQIDTPPFTSTLCYKNNVDIGGHLYSLVLEVSDTNGCVGKLTKVDSVLLYPKFERLSYTTDTTMLCFKTKVTFTNTSLMPNSRVKKFRWVFGDGGEDSINWLLAHHDYTQANFYNPLLIVTDTQNCLDTLYGPTLPVWVVSPDTNLNMQGRDTQCYKGNGFGFSSINGIAEYYWSVYDYTYGTITNFPRSNTLDDSLFNFSAPTCGTYAVRLTVQKLGCRFSVDTIIHILGPKSIIETADNRVVNGHQCEIKDTVYVIPFLSCVNQSGYELSYLWDFDDPFAPLCTLDTRRGINIGMNCRYSVDSVMVDHFYTPGKERCYLPSLLIKDTVLGCEHQDWVNLPLQKPLASQDTSIVPPREGLKLAPGSRKCLNQPLDFIYPSCDFVQIFFFPDSLCDTCEWLDMGRDTIAYNLGRFNYIYEHTVDSEGWVTVGLVLGNGELGGEMCYDTAWYHHFLQLKPIDSRYTIDITGCGPHYQVKFIPHDTVQFDLDYVIWNMGNVAPNTYPSFRSIETFLPGDSIVHTPLFTLMGPGAYITSSYYKAINGCYSEMRQSFSIGAEANFGSLRPITCIQDSVDLFSDILYYNHLKPKSIDDRPYWLDQEREEAGKEKVWWDIGDGNGFAYTGGRVMARYGQAGWYTIKMAYQDSIGCMDTLVKNQLVVITDIKSYIKQPDNQYYCAPQIISFFDSSIVYDELPVTRPSLLDSIVTWSWNFGDQTVLGSLQHPAHQYRNNGVFDVSLVATDIYGCSDTAYTTVTIVGPTPTFDIVDTLGCVPFTVVLANTSQQQLKNWTWYFGDSANQTLTTVNPDSVRFTYNKPGVYDIKLLGSQDIVNPTTGNMVNCNHFFPDQVTQLPVRRIRVLPIAAVDFEMEDSLCAGESVVFVSHYDSTYTKLAWHISNGTQMPVNAPDSIRSHVFDSTGLYTVWLVPVENPSTYCVDSASKVVHVFDVKAAFETNPTNSPHYYFTNQSAGGNQFRWNFGKPSEWAKNESTSFHADFDYGQDSADYEICLVVMNEAGCLDSVCEIIQVRPRKLIIPNVFTPGNSDGYNDAFDINILGEVYYHLTIYNRWGTKVFEGFADGHQNDGINWNGNDHQTGPACSEGVYYYVFGYRFFNETETSETHGTITLIRE